ncbi:MAG TPA: TonB-dependent receptor [Blastocatellia bacterium]
MFSRFLRAAAFAFALIFTLSLFAYGDDLDNVTFTGSIRDNSGAAIQGAKVILTHAATGIQRKATSDAVGRYRITESHTGSYSLSVIASGFRQEQSKEILTSSGRNVSLDFILSPSGVSEQMTVEAPGIPIVDTSRTVAGDTISRRELEELPIITRDPLQLVSFLGGVAEAPLSTSELAEEGQGRFLRGTPEEAGLLSLTGAPATSNNITVDGLDNNDDRAARERVALNPESIAELQVITNQYAAEYGRASGGRINIRTRGGTNHYGGELYLFFGDESLNANTYFRNARGLGRVPQQQRREGAVVSGPASRQRGFFFASYERFDVTDFVEINALLPVKTNPLFPLPTPNLPPSGGSPVALFSEEISTPETRNLFNARADFNFSQSHNVSLRCDLLRGSNKRGFPGGSRLPDSILIEGRNSDSISLADNFIISASLVNQARSQYSSLRPRNRSSNDSVGVIIREPSRIIAGTFTGSAAAPASAREEKRAQFQDNLSFLKGSHLLKVGADVQLVRSSFADLFATGGEYTFETVEDFLGNAPSRFVQRFNTESKLSNNVAGLFVQDEWKVKPGVTFSFGLRWDNESIIHDRDNISPRVAIAWDPFVGGVSRNSGRSSEAGKTVVRAGFGIFYNRALLRTIDDFSLGAMTTTVDSDVTPEALTAVRFPQGLKDESIIGRFGLPETMFLRRMSAELEIPYTIQAGLGVERQVGKGLVVTADYIFTRGAHLWRESNVNAPVLPPGFASFTEFLLDRDFENRPAAGGRRPIVGASADIVRFDLGVDTSTTRGAIRVENGIRVLTLGLNAPRSSNISAALNAIRFLRPDPSLTQVEQLESSGNSFYHGGILAARYAAARRVHFRAVYTLSKLIDEGTTNTGSPQILSDRRAERALSLQDQRHRISFSGLFQVPLIGLDFAPVVSFGSSRPFNIGAGFDRNLNDIENDRPNFLTPTSRPEWRRPGSVAGDIKGSLALAPIGSGGNLPRNYGRGPGTRVINMRASRSFTLGERVKLRPAVDVFNLFNNSVFSFGSEFIDRDDADFLIPRRTQRPRVIQLNLKVSF